MDTSSCWYRLFDAPAHEVFEVMNGLQVTRMLVVDHDKKLVGMLTHFDLARAMEETNAGP